MDCWEVSHSPATVRADARTRFGCGFSCPSIGVDGVIRDRAQADQHMRHPLRDLSEVTTGMNLAPRCRGLDVRTPEGCRVGVQAGNRQIVG